MTNNEDENLGSFYMGKMRPPPEPERVLPRGLLTGVIVLAFVAVLWWAYPQGQEKYTDMDVPVVQADTSPYKSAPEDPGGMEVRHQDSTIFDPMEKKGDTVEKLMPAPEQPVDKAEVLGKEPPVLDSKKPELNLEMQGDAVVAPVPTPEPEKIPEKIIEKAVENPSPAPAQEETPKKETATSSGDVYIQLGSYRNKAGAEKDWKTLQGKYSQLKGLSLKIERVDLGKKGIFYRLQAGKLTEARANEICAVLKKSNAGGCILVR